MENIVQSQEHKPQIDDGGPVGLYPVVSSQGKHAFDVLGELAEQEQHLRASMAEKAPDARPNIVHQQFPVMPVVESMTQAIDRPENWVFKEWLDWHHANATPHEKYLMLASWKEAKLNTINIDSEKRDPDAWQSRANPDFLTTDRNQVSQWIASGYGVRALYASGQQDGLTGDQLYAITQLYNAVKDSGIEYHENSNLATAMRTVVEWFRT